MKRESRQPTFDQTLELFQHLDLNRLSLGSYIAACAQCGWSEPSHDGVGQWETSYPKLDTRVCFVAPLSPVSVIAWLDYIAWLDHFDEDDSALLIAGESRRRFDETFKKVAAMLTERFPGSVKQSTFQPPYHWHFVGVRGKNSLIQLEQSYYDPIMGAQLLLILQPLPPEQRDSVEPISAKW